MRTTGKYLAKTVFFNGKVLGGMNLQCGHCCAELVSPYPHKDEPEFCAECKEELLYPEWATW